MTLEQLRIFVTVAEKLHFTRAAAELGLTQSAVSAAVAALENGAGFSFFHRVGRRVELSGEGAAFLKEARQVLAAARHAGDVLDEMSGLARGTLSVMGSQTVATYWLPPLLHRFHRRYPGIVLDLSIGNTAQVADAVVTGRAELGFVEGEVDLPELSRDDVAEDRLALVAGKEYAWVADHPPEREVLAGVPWILREKGSGTRVAALSLLASFGIRETEFHLAFELPSNEAVRVAVEAGAGVSVLSTLAAASGLAAGTLKAAPCELPTRRFRALRHRERRPSRASLALMGLIPADGFQGRGLTSSGPGAS